MEKSWENFWTTGKVEDYLTYRNRASMCGEDTGEEDEKIKKQQPGLKAENEDSCWKGFT